MKLVFRVNYHTVPGQDLWLRLALCHGAGASRIVQTVPMRWLNEHQWEGALELDAVSALHLKYSYQLRQPGNGVELDEWLAPRVLELDPAVTDAVVALDTWRSAGAPDYVLETKPFAVLLPPRGPFVPAPAAILGTHEFELHMAAVPSGRVPCILGSSGVLGDWQWSRALPMVEVSDNLWRLAITLPCDADIEYKYGLWDIADSRMVSIEGGANRCLFAHAYGSRQRTRVCDGSYQRGEREMFRGTGVAVPVFSLRSEAGLGVGEFADLKLLADWAAGAGMRMVQILPVNDTTSSHLWTDSYPYSAISVCALHPLYLRLEDLSQPLAPTAEAEVAAIRGRLNALPEVDYEAVMRTKLRFTRSVFDLHLAEILTDAGFGRFFQDQCEWVLPYAAFCMMRDRHRTADFSRWGEWAEFSWARVEAIMDAGGQERVELLYHVWLQYELDRQLSAAVDYLHARGLVLKGDLPIGIDRHSVEAWMSPHLFNLDVQAGAPPDAFAIKGQNWGFPTYNWEAMRQDGYAWWRARFARLGRFFDVYRIDHILGFFRIWQVPQDHVEGIMGWFDPAMPVGLDELRARGIDFEFNRYCRPYIREHSLWEMFGDEAEWVRHEFMEDCGFGHLRLRGFVDTQRKIANFFKDLIGSENADGERHRAIMTGLFDCVSEVLLLEVPGAGGRWFHPRCGMHLTRSYQELDGDARWRLDLLYQDYFHHRQDAFWQAEGYAKLPALRRASGMLLCGEDLGMVPGCVPGVMAELGMLSLEIQRMPKNSHTTFFHPADAPYLSVVSPSTHDMSTLRGWWREDAAVTAQFAWSMLGMDFPPLNLSGAMAERIIGQHLHAPAMWAVLPLQDLLAIDETLRHPVPEAERINVPAIMPYYWRYRSHLGLEQLSAADGFNQRLHDMITTAGR